MRTAKFILLLAVALVFSGRVHAASGQLLGWNNLGMHCMDSDYSVFSILPPYNTIEAQLVVGGRLVKDGSSYKITFQALADPDGSFNSTAMGKGNFYAHAEALYGAKLAPEMGLAGWAMPGLSNAPQSMLFETTNQPAAGVSTAVNWWRAEGIPLSPYDDAGRKNPYPLMRLIAWNTSNQPVATNDVVLPISDEMDCRACHASGSAPAAQPLAGWVWNGLPERDYRLNILRLHDERLFASAPAFYAEALQARHFNPQGLYRGVIADGQPVLCASCHASEALGAPSYKTVPPLTTSMHGFHAHVIDPVSQMSLDQTANRAACYRCHPGSTTRCLRGAMGGAVAADGSMEMQCQSCHGNMSAVGTPTRVGWFMEPNCQSCHSGTAASNGGQIRYTSAFDESGAVRLPVDRTFATQQDTPAPGLSLYRFSAGHGGLQCSACHGSTHAEFPSTHRNDNLASLGIQRHAGVLIECTACHTTIPNTVTGGPHGLHPVGADWVSRHPDALEAGQATRSQCQVCHGTDYRGTVLSRAQADRSFTVFGGKTFFRGAIIGCYSCHNGPGSESSNSSAAPVATAIATNTPAGIPVSAALTVSPSTAVLRVISQPVNGTIGVSNNVLTYFPMAGFVGPDTFTYAAWNGSKNSILATGTVQVTALPATLKAQAFVPPSYPAAWPVPFRAVTVPSRNGAVATVNWDFGDGTLGTNELATHVYAAPGNYSWKLTATCEAATVQETGVLRIGPPVLLSLVWTNGNATLSWSKSTADAFLEQAASFAEPISWAPVTNSITGGSDSLSATVPAVDGGFFRLHVQW